jgi:hypothetical protein
MNIRELNKPINSKTLNETLAKKFGTKINVESFTLEQLQDARNKIRTKLSDIETNESFSGLTQNETYAKNKLFLDVLNAAIQERADVMEKGAKPDYLDFDKDGDKKEPMKKALKDKKKKPVGEDQVDEFDGVDSPYDSDKNKMRAIQKKFGTKSDLGKMSGDRYWQYGGPGGNKKVAGDDVEIDDPAVQMMIDAGMLKLNPDALKAYNAIPPAKRAEVMKIIDRFNKNKAAMAADPGNKPMAKAKKEPPSSLFDLLGAKESMDEGKQIIENYFKYSLKLLEGEEDKAELVMAAKDMVDRLTGWMEDTAEMQSESMLELADAIRDEMGAQQSESFTNTVKPALESLYAAMEQTRVSLTQGVGMLTGEAEVAEPMGDEPAMEPEAEMEPTVDAEGATDEFAAAEAAAGGEDEAGRARRESVNLSRRLGTILSSRK